MDGGGDPAGKEGSVSNFFPCRSFHQTHKEPHYKLLYTHRAKLSRCVHHELIFGDSEDVSLSLIRSSLPKWSLVVEGLKGYLLTTDCLRKAEVQYSH